MSEGTTNNPDPANTNPDPGKETAPPQENVFDTSKLSDEDFKKVLEDPRLWKNERIAAGLDAQKKLKAKETEDAKRQEEEMAKNKQFEELAQKHKSEAEQWQTKFNDSVIDNAIITQAAKLNPHDLDGLLKLIDRAEIKIEDDKVVGVDTAIETLKTSKPYLFNTQKGPNNVGVPSNPDPKNPGILEMTRAQLNDPVFYQANSEQIKKGNFKLVD